MENHIKYCTMREGEIPIIDEVDIIIAGGTVGSIAAASKATCMGAKVFVIGYLPYMGEDICGTYKYLFEYQKGDHPLHQKMFSEDRERTPFAVKKVLEDELIDNGIHFLYSSYVTDVLYDDQLKPAGVIIANRSGRQVIRGKVIIDATQGAYVAKLAGAPFQEEKSDGPQQFQFMTVGNPTDVHGGKTKLPIAPKWKGDEFPAYEYTCHFPMEDWSYPSICNVEQEIRGRTWDADQVDSSDHLFYIPPFKIEGFESCTQDTLKIEELPIGAFVSKNVEHMYVLGSCADIKRAFVPDMLRPANMIALGEMIGEASACEARKFDLSASAALKKREETPSLKGSVATEGSPIRPSVSIERMTINNTLVPVLGEYEVVVVGGGTAGANAAISAARHGACTLVLEYLHGFGGLQTMGRIGVYWDGYREGFTKEIDKGVREMGPMDHPRQKTINESGFSADWKMEWYRTQIRNAGGSIWFGVLGCGAFVENGCVKGVLVATPQGMGVVLARVVIDSTGSGDIAIAAGARYEDTNENLFAVQGAGLPYVNPGDHYNNTDWTFVDDNDIFDTTRLFVSGKSKYEHIYDLGKLPQTRERRRIIGDHTVSVLDVMNHRRYKDTISYHMSSFDTHGYTVDPFFTILPPPQRHTIYDADVPLASLLPQGLDNIIVTGLGASAHRDAMPVIRMQPCLQNQGYSVGLLSALSVRDNCAIRQMDIKKVQTHLVAKGILPQRVLTDADNFPFSDEALKEAVSKLPHDFDGLQILLTDREKAAQLLLDAYAQSKQESEKTVYAQVLCMLGNGSGVQYVIDSVRSYVEWDEGWNYTGMGQFGPCMSKLDSLIIALGESKEEKALSAILEMAELLSPAHEFSHFRAIALACESIGSPTAAPVLSTLLKMQGMTGHHITTLQQARDGVVPSPVDVTIRNRVLREIYIARALYRCGDDKQKGMEILRNYSNDLHGHYFRHAWSVLKRG